MFSCLWQLWDWIDPPTFTTMESKKLQQLQQANSHLAPMPQMKPPAGGGGFQHPPPGGYDYGATAATPGRSTMYPPNGAQYQGYGQHGQHGSSLRSPYSTGSPKSSLSTNSGAMYGATDVGDLSSTSGGPSYHMPPGQQGLMHAHQQQQFRSNTLGPGGGYGYDHQQQLYRVSSPSSGSGGAASGERERLYQTAPLVRSGVPANETDKIMRSHVPSYHGTVDTTGPAVGMYGEEESLYHQKSGYPQGITSPPGANSEIIIQQNIPGQVVNQACQTQISSMVLAGNSGVPQQPQQQVKSSPSDTLSSPSHDSSERRRGGSGQQHTLKSPVTKRPANAPVALSGWLYKQGSDGLKVWRRRWFVLSEYVLYYYKGQEEEKLLGTVLLPSYKVSACFPEDKIYRKFAFKCEHANMRTFVFAAENGESMSQWVRALTLATMMIQHVGSEQEGNLNQQQYGTKGGASGGEPLSSDSSGTGGPQSQGSNDTMKLIQQASGNGSSSSSGAGTSGLNDSLPQPLYANAPPKPRRVNDAGYSSPSPEHTMLHDRYEQMVQHQQMLFPGVASGTQGGGLALGNNRTPTALTAQAIYGDPKRIERDLYIQKLIEQQQQQQQLNAAKQQQQQQQQQNLGVQSSPLHGQVLRTAPGTAGTNPFLYPSNDRRTPDTYGPPNAAIDPKHMSDYEDIYNLTMLSKSLPSNAAGPLDGMSGEVGAGTGGTTYKRPSSPLRYESNGAFPSYMGNSLYNAGQFEQTLTAGTAPLPQHVQMRARPIPPNIPRPHSADFLDYEARHPLNQTVSGVTDEPSPVHRTPRPKSSLDINRTPDHYYYSEASYAEKMRLQSASYLQRAHNSAAGGASRKQQRSDELQGLFASGTMPREGLYRSGSGKLIPSQQQQHPADTDYPLGSQSMPRPSATDRAGTAGVRPTVSSLKKQSSGTSQQQQQEQFARSASARLPRKEEDSSLRDGERKREESMKRLLEWKQRMLQSPLTKKIASQHSATMASAESLNPGSSTSVSGDRRHDDIYGMKSEDSLLRGDYYAATYERQSIGDLTTIGSSAAARKHSGSVANIAQTSAFGSQMKLNGDYNSYSSDDEGKWTVSMANLITMLLRTDSCNGLTIPRLSEAH
uniref:PH domain-containing protein n=1 Tax=Anopheles culicifacies TaxID=139723 RepID=A0A182M4T4_9DIPT